MTRGMSSYNAGEWSGGGRGATVVIEDTSLIGIGGSRKKNILGGSTEVSQETTGERVIPPAST